MRRLLPRLLPLLAALVLAGCGGAQSGGDGGGAPAPADLAADALAALEDAGSAHYVVDVSVEGHGTDGFDGALHAEGDASLDAFTAEGTVTFEGVSLPSRLLASRDELFLQFMGQWYGDPKLGLDQADEEAPSPDEVRRYFDDVFTGSVGEGPDIAGVATWRFEGQLNPDGFADLTERFEDEEVTDAEREVIRAIAEHTRFVFDVGRDDSLPRHLEMSVDLADADLPKLGPGVEDSEFDDFVEFDVHAEADLSEFGKDVSYEPPTDYRPLDQLFDELFGSFE
jgi:hypothetical protein